jgi:alkanesulfonate monooxygenase SsuD/methylene tetrahydromethanopterin reductase-like flavin-dependent oxidoreductase (luciferase family)
MREEAAEPAANPVIASPLARTDAGMTFGLMLPHFGPQVTAERLLGAGELAERLGFSAVWVRDHLLWRPHAHEERSSIAFVESMVTLATLGARTKSLFLGTSVLIPVRHPIKVAQELASLSYLTGGRVVAGMGAGHDRAELELGGVDPKRKRQAAIEMIRLVKQALGRDNVEYHGEIYQIEGASLEPKPARPLPILFGGPSRAAAEIAVTEADGFIIGTLPFLTMDDRLAYLREREEQLGRRMTLVSVPRVRIERDRARARASVNIAGMVEDGQHHWIKPASGWWNTLEDVEGAVFAGEPMDIVEGVLKLHERGFDHFAFDVRFQFDRFEELVELIAAEIVPVLRRETSRSPAPA